LSAYAGDSGAFFKRNANAACRGDYTYGMILPVFGGEFFSSNNK